MLVTNFPINFKITIWNRKNSTVTQKIYYNEIIQGILTITKQNFFEFAWVGFTLLGRVLIHTTDPDKSYPTFDGLRNYKLKNYCEIFWTGVLDFWITICTLLTLIVRIRHMSSCFFFVVVFYLWHFNCFGFKLL